VVGALRRASLGLERSEMIASHLGQNENLSRLKIRSSRLKRRDRGQSVRCDENSGVSLLESEYGDGDVKMSRETRSKRERDAIRDGIEPQCFDEDYRTKTAA
jgi:hypothetical protein